MLKVTNPKIEKPKKYPERLPRFLGLMGGIFLIFWFVIDIPYLLNETTDLFLSLLFLLPVLAGLIGAIKIKNRPIIGGLFMLIGGSVSFLEFLMFSFGGVNPFILFPLFMLIGGVLALIRNKKILEAQN